MRGRWAIVALALGCANRPATQIVVRIHTDLDPGTSLLAVSVRATRVLGGTIGEREFPTFSSVGLFRFPGEVRLVPYDPEDTSPVRVEVTARVLASPDESDFTQTAIVRFESGRTLQLDMALARRCAFAAARAECEPPTRGTTCGWLGAGRDGCERIERPMLPDDGTSTSDRSFHGCPVCQRCADAGAGDDAALTPAACEERCTDIDNDVRNCGACGHACPTLAVCRAGQCVTG